MTAGKRSKWEVFKVKTWVWWHAATCKKCKRRSSVADSDCTKWRGFMIREFGIPPNHIVGGKGPS